MKPAQIASPSVSQHGVLRAREGERSFDLTRHAPSNDLSYFIERYWIVRWDLRGRPPHLQETLPHPCVNLVFHAGRTAVVGIPTRRFAILLEGEGLVVGVKFKPGAFYPFVRFPMTRLTGRTLPIEEAFSGVDGAALERAVLTERDDTGKIALVEAFLRPHFPERDPNVETVVRVVQIALEDRELLTVDALAARSGLPARSLQRLFQRYVGVSPKWVIQRYRLHEAVSRAEEGVHVDWAALAHDLGYFDQAHFIRDFKAHVGRSPAEHAASCARSPTEGRAEPARRISI